MTNRRKREEEMAMNMIRYRSCNRVMLVLTVTAIAVTQGCIPMTPMEPPAGFEPECMADADCDDEVFCNGAEVCVAGDCVAGDPPCPTDQPCVECDENADACTVPECVFDADCDDGRFCNGLERCSDCVCESGEEPCRDDQVCDEDIDECQPGPFSLQCAIEPVNPCGGPAGGRETILTSTVENARGTLTYSWQVSQGELDDPALPNPILSLVLPREGPVTNVTLTITDTFLSDGIATSINASCERAVTNPFPGLFANARADQSAVPAAADFGGSSPFSAGASLISGQTGGALPTIFAQIFPRPADFDFDVMWEVVGVPPQARIEDVLIESIGVTLEYRIAPNPEARVPANTSDGQLVTLSNVVVPGTYTFRFTVHALMSGITACDEVALTLILPAEVEVDGP